MKLKTISTCLLLVVLCLQFTACGKFIDPKTTTQASVPPTQTESSEDGPEEPFTIFEITVWCENNLVELTRRQIESFNIQNGEGLRIQANVVGMREDELVAGMLDDVASGADLLFFASDRLAALAKAGALTRLGEEDAAAVNESNEANAARAAAWSGGVYAYPMSAEGSYFLYYDKTVIQDPTNLETILADCEAADRTICFELDNGWYAASFFFGAGCASDWTMGQDGRWIVKDNFQGTKGLAAMKGLNQLMNSPKYVSESGAAAFQDGTAAVIGGVCDAIPAEQMLGDKLGVAVLPKFTVDDESYPLIPFLRCEMLGVKPQRDADRAAALRKLARYLTGTEAQLERCRALSLCPSNLEAIESNEIQKDPVRAVAAMQLQSAYLQKAPDGWWELLDALAAGAAKGEDEADWNEALQRYHDGVLLLEKLRPGLLFVGAWNGWNNLAVDDTYMLTGDGELLSLTLEVPEGEDRGGRIVTNGKWENDKGYAQISTGKELALDLGAENPDNNIVFAEPGTYRISINTTNNEITLERLDAPAPEETE